MSKPKSAKGEGYKPQINLGLTLEPALNARVEEYLKDKGMTKREYVKELICRDLGLKFVPAHYEEVKE